VRMLVANFPGLEKHMADQHYRVTVGTYDLALDEIHDPAGQQDIMIVPVMAGAGGGRADISWHWLNCIYPFFCFWCWSIWQPAFLVLARRKAMLVGWKHWYFD
jgi:predicted phage tail protein